MRGIMLLYSLFHADRHTGLEVELQKELADLYISSSFFTSASSNFVMVRG